jgi:hypothetical protein
MVCAARGVTPSPAAIMLAEAIGRARIKSTKAGSFELDRRPVS